MSASGLPAGDWAMQQVAGFLAAISRLPDEDAMISAAVHRIAEAVDAEVCALVGGRDVVASVGFPAHRVPVDELLEVAWADRRSLPAPGLGELATASIQLHLDTPSRMVVARSDDPLDRHDIHLLRTMAQVLDLALNLRRAADRERELRRASEEQSAELRTTNAKLAEASRVKSDLISVASHELRTPLTSIIGFTDLILQHWDHLHDDERRDHLSRVDRHGRRLLHLVDDLLLVGRIDSGAIRAEPVAVDVVSACANLAADVHTSFTIEGPGAIHAAVDPVHLDQIITNLLTNAAKYGREPYAIDLSGDDDTVQIVVTDHGDGVPETFVPRLFERFAQASTGDARNGSGTGLGLSIVAGLAATNGGTVRYEREHSASRFVVRLPRADPSQVRAAPLTFTPS